MSKTTISDRQTKTASLRSVGEALLEVKRTLASHLETDGHESRRDLAIEAEVLLAHVLGVHRSALFTHPGRKLDARERAGLIELVARRLSREPVAYLVGRREFYGLDLRVDRRVLIPRPETELVVERAILEAQRLGGEIAIADIGTGSGAISVALAKQLPAVKLYAVDISPDALNVAALNCLDHGIADRVSLLHGDLLAPLPKPVQLIVANLPYVTAEEMRALAPEVADYEPRLALAAGEDGLDLYNRLIDRVARYLWPGGTLICELAPHQVTAIEKRALAALPNAQLGIDQDLAGCDRVFWARLPW